VVGSISSISALVAEEWQTGQYW